MSQFNELSLSGHSRLISGRRLLLLLIGSSLIACLIASLHPKRQEVGQALIPTVSLAEAKKLHPLWVDARSKEQFTNAHIPGALSLDDQHWEEGFLQVASVFRPGRVIIVYCSSVSCHSSHETAIRLKRELGASKVYVLEGGFESWQKDGSLP